MKENAFSVIHNFVINPECSNGAMRRKWKRWSYEHSLEHSEMITGLQSLQKEHAGFSSLHHCSLKNKKPSNSDPSLN